MKLSGITKKMLIQIKNSENVPKLESVCSKQTIWTVNKYFITFFNNDEHS